MHRFQDLVILWLLLSIEILFLSSKLMKEEFKDVDMFAHIIVRVILTFTHPKMKAFTIFWAFSASHLAQIRVTHTKRVRPHIITSSLCFLIGFKDDISAIFIFLKSVVSNLISFWMSFLYFVLYFRSWNAS